MSEEYAHPLHRGIGGSMYTRKAHATLGQGQGLAISDLGAADSVLT
jgi:hypothetical protein